MTIGQRLLKTAGKALETLAEQEFSREKIVEACRTAAAKGFVQCQIRPSIPVDVSATEHMKALRAELQKEWLQLAWIPHAMPGEVPYKVLEVRWDRRST
jgi:enoyl-[acyl-carrier-protein] reductase (NADH)